MALRYFGSKGWFKEKLDELVPEDTKILVSPFLGSGKAELHLAKRRPELTVLGSDLFEPLVNFHQKLQDGSLLESLQTWVGASIDKERYHKMLENTDDAATFFMVMRNSFHGKFGDFDQAGKLTKVTLTILSKLRFANFMVEQRDALDAIRNAPDGAVIFADPPYFQTQKYYAKAKQGDIQFQKALADALTQRGLPFILCTNDAPEVLKLYIGCKIESYRRACRTSKEHTKQYDEIVITHGV